MSDEVYLEAVRLGRRKEWKPTTKFWWFIPYLPILYLK